MMFKSVMGTLKDPTDNKEVAKAIFNFFLWQYDQALIEEINTRCEANAFKAANEAAEREYKESQEMGWGPELPYSEATIKLKEEEVVRAQKSLAEARAFLNFIRDRFVDDFI